MLVKAAGGIRSADDAVAMVKAGASRLGTSRGPSLVPGKAAGNDADSNGEYRKSMAQQQRRQQQLTPTPTCLVVLVSGGRSVLACNEVY